VGMKCAWLGRKFHRSHFLALPSVISRMSCHLALAMAMPRALPLRRRRSSAQPHTGTRARPEFFHQPEPRARRRSCAPRIYQDPPLCRARPSASSLPPPRARPWSPPTFASRARAPGHTRRILIDEGRASRAPAGPSTSRNPNFRDAPQQKAGTSFATRARLRLVLAGAPLFQSRDRVPRAARTMPRPAP
jgi:hypothetical protein